MPENWAAHLVYFRRGSVVELRCAVGLTSLQTIYIRSGFCIRGCLALPDIALDDGLWDIWTFRFQLKQCFSFHSLLLFSILFLVRLLSSIFYILLLSILLFFVFLILSVPSYFSFYPSALLCMLHGVHTLLSIACKRLAVALEMPTQWLTFAISSHLWSAVYAIACAHLNGLRLVSACIAEDVP